MPSPGSAPPLTCRGLLELARARERDGFADEAIGAYESAVRAAEAEDTATVLAESLRRLAILRHHRDESGVARGLCQRSGAVARAAGHPVLAAEALNTLGGIELTTGSLAVARASFLDALELGGANRELTARVEQNLGILANIQGQLDEALSRYRRSLEAYRSACNEHGCAIAYHNLGMISADLGRLVEADDYFRQSRLIAERLGDRHLRALCLASAADVDVARQRFEDARQGAEAALDLFEQLGVRGAKADAYRVIGMVYRETGKPALAEARLRSAIEVAASAGMVLNEAEARRELAELFQMGGQNREALLELSCALGLFQRLDARADLVHVGARVAELEGLYQAVVRAWGRSLESADQYTFGHSERVAQTAVALARALGLGAHEETTVLLGAYLHDVGMLRVPHDILVAPEPLSRRQRDVVEQHPLWGLELLAGIEFPWDLKPIIRWHHERCDGSGYPDGLRGDAIPLGAQIVGIAEMFDALTTSRVRQRALSDAEARQCIREHRDWWSPAVVEALLDRMPRPRAREDGMR